MFEDYYMPEFDADYFNSPAFQQAIAAAVQQYSPTPVAAPVYTPPAQSFRGISRRGEYDYYEPGIGYIPEDVYTPAVESLPERLMYVEPESISMPAVVPSTVEAEPVAGIGTPSTSTSIPSVILTAEGYKPNPAYTADVAMQRYRAELPNNNYYSPQERQQIMSSIENAYAQPGATGEQISDAYQNASVAATRARPQVGPVAGIGSPAVTATAAAPSVIETAAPAAAAATGTGLQVINANSYSPSDTDLQAMQLSRDQWNGLMSDLSGLDLGGLNFGNSFGVTDPDATSNFRTFTAPKSNKGNPTSTVAKKDNTFNLIEGQPIRLVDMRTGKVAFQGTGYEAADKAIEIAAGLTKAGGNKADWEIQTGQFKNPGSGDLVFGDTFKTVANEKKNTSFVNQALDVLGDAALGFIIGGPVGAAIAAGASVAGVNVSDIAYPMISVALLAPAGGFFAVAGAAALGSAVSSAVQGRSVEETLIRAGVTGLTAGVMQGTDIGGDISKAVGGVLKDIGFESQVGNIVTGVTDAVRGIGTEAATREIIVNAATKAAVDAAAAAAATGAVSSAVSGAVVDAVKSVVPGYTPSPETTAALNKLDEAAAAANQIVVTANPVTTAVSGANPIVGTIANGVITPILSGNDSSVVDGVDQKTGEIVANAPKVTTPPETTAGIGGVANPVINGVDQVTGEIVANAPKVTTPPETTAGIGGVANPVINGVDQVTGEIVANAPKVTTPPETTAGIGGVINPVINGVDQVTGEIVAEAPRTVTPPLPPLGPIVPTLGPLTPPPSNPPTETPPPPSVIDIIKTVVPLIPLVTGGGGGGGGTLPPDTTGLTFTPNPLRPTIPGTGIGGVGGRYPYTPTTYGRVGGDQETEYMFFTRDPVTKAPTAPATAPATAPVRAPAVPAAAINPTTIPVIQAPAPTITAAQPNSARYEEAVLRGSMTPQERALMRLVDQQQAAAVNPGAVPVKKEGGEIDDDMVKHLVDYHKNGGHRGPGQVKGIGSGQEDKIPAYLSDGEYVWSAQDVSDLGDGSNREGVRRLDKMRQMVRSQAGRKDVKKIAKPQKGIDRMLKAVGGMA
jgi:hypothetical protein